MEGKICIHKYLTKTITNPQPPGLGDFLRGTVALYNYSKIYNYKLYLDNSHPIFNFLKENNNIITDISTNIIELISPLSYEEIDSNLKKIFEKNESFTIMTNSFYTRKNNILENHGDISYECKLYLKNILIPNNSLEEKINYIYNNIYNIDITKGYKAIHIRSGDKYIHNINNHNRLILNNLCHKINNFININNDIQYVLICDSRKLAIKIKNNINKLKYWDNNKIHLGNLINNNNNNGIMDTLVDFFILSRANEIIATFSGFSKIVSCIYDITYTLL